jgi:uncharacterized protein (DUF2384 family)
MRRACELTKFHMIIPVRGWDHIVVLWSHKTMKYGKMIKIWMRSLKLRSQTYSQTDQEEERLAREAALLRRSLKDQ